MNTGVVCQCQEAHLQFVAIFVVNFGEITVNVKFNNLKSAVLGHTALSNRPQYHAQTAIITQRVGER